jgi:hypothetical protein
VAIVNKFFIAEAAYQSVGQYSIQIIAKQHINPFKKKKKE